MHLKTMSREFSFCDQPDSRSSSQECEVPCAAIDISFRGPIDVMNRTRTKPIQTYSSSAFIKQIEKAMISGKTRMRLVNTGSMIKCIHTETEKKSFIISPPSRYNQVRTTEDTQKTAPPFPFSEELFHSPEQIRTFVRTGQQSARQSPQSRKHLPGYQSLHEKVKSSGKEITPAKPMHRKIDRATPNPLRDHHIDHNNNIVKSKQLSKQSEKTASTKKGKSPRSLLEDNDKDTIELKKRLIKIASAKDIREILLKRKISTEGLSSRSPPKPRHLGAKNASIDMCVTRNHTSPKPQPSTHRVLKIQDKHLFARALTHTERAPAVPATSPNSHNIFFENIVKLKDVMRKL
jgi:hypothetical protein